MNKLFKTIGICSISFLTIFGLVACKNSKTTTKKNTTTSSNTTDSVSTTKKRTTGKGTTSKTSTKPSSSKCKIQISGAVSGLSVTPKINGVAVDLSKEYPVGSIVDVDIVNTLNKFYRVTASMENKKYKAKWIDRCYDASDPDEIVNETLNGIELLDDLVLTVTEVTKSDGVDYINVALVLDDSKDTTTLTNTVKVYEPNTWEVAYENGDEAIEGQKLAVVLYNYASDTTILVRKSGEILKQQKYNQLAPGADGYYVTDFTIENDCEEVYIETDCKEETVMDARVVNTMFNPTGISYKLYDDGTEIASETPIEINSVITCEITNASDSDITATAYLAGGDELEAVVITAGTSKTLSKTATNSVIFAIEPYVIYNVTYTSSAANVSLLVKDKNNSDIPTNTAVARYSKINISITNPDDVDYAIKIKMRDDYYDNDMIDKTIILAKNSNWKPEGDFLLYGDLTISVVSVEKYTLTINNSFDEDHADVFTSIMDTDLHPISGDSINDGDELGIVIMFDSTDYKVTLTNGSETILDNVTPSSSYYTIPTFTVKGNVVLTIVAK